MPNQPTPITPPPDITPLDEPTPPQKQAPPSPTRAQSASTEKQLTPTPPTPVVSRTHQPNPTKTAVADSQTIENTLEKLRAMQDQTKPPTHRYNPDQGGAPDAGGSLNGDATSQLTAGEMKGIGAHVRDCWSYDAGAQNADTFDAHMEVTVDATGTVRVAKVVSTTGSQGLDQSTLQIFSERAVRALLDPHCATLPLPPHMLGQTQTLRFNFRP